MDFPAGAPTFASLLRDAGYATFAVGKWHLARELEQSAAGSRHGWPLQRGFDRFYGFLDGFTNFFHPHQLVEDNHHLDIDSYPDDYYLTDDLTERSASMIKELRAADPAKPFFLYLAHGAVHAPLQAPQADIEPFRGAYDIGWDEVRRRRFDRQQELGLFGEELRLPPMGAEPGEEVEEWESLSPERRTIAARHMEVYAAMVATVDRSVGRLRLVLDQLGEWENTVFVFLSDNGASSDLGPSGTTRYMLGHGMPVPDDPAFDLERLDRIGGTAALSPLSAGMGIRRKHTHFGCTSATPMRAATPCRASFTGRTEGSLAARSARGTPMWLICCPRSCRWRTSSRLSLPSSTAGRSSSTMFDGDAPSPRTEQMYESHGNRALHSGEWDLVAEHTALAPFDDAEWRLYGSDRDPFQATDVASARADVVDALSRRWHELALAGEVFPMEDGSGVFFHQRPAEHRPDAPALFLPGIPTVERIRARDLIWNRSFRIEMSLAYVAGDGGVLVSHGDQGAGYVLYVEDGRLAMTLNAGGVMSYLDAGPLKDGTSEIVVDVRCPVLDRWDVEIVVGVEVRASVEGVWMRTGLMTPLHGVDIGVSRGSPVDWDLGERHGSYRYVGVLHGVRYFPGDYAADAPQLRVEEFRQLGLAVPGGDRLLPMTHEEV
jgi:arylsulfatase A-like enzyme